MHRRPVPALVALLLLGACGRAPAPPATVPVVRPIADQPAKDKPAEEPLPAKVEFNRDIRPIFADVCFGCHGADLNKAEGGLSLISLAHATAVPKSGGQPAIVPGQPTKSELVARILDAEEPMPPKDSHKALTGRQKKLLEKWVAQGAQYQQHWAYLPPAATPTPAVRDAKWPLSFPDNYLLARLEREGLAPAPEADKATLCRRLYLDLLGLPPTPAQVDAFVADQRPDAYERLVDQLLADPHHGERMASYWFDLVRYADTVGLHGDQGHKAAVYRDFVIDAFIRNLPQDKFIQWQLGGDLVPGLQGDERNDALVASCFNRLILTSHEGGIQLKEYTAIYQADRVRNTSLALMGASMGCCQCHDHKYDPFTARDFYALGAVFADIDDLQHVRDQYRGPNNREVTLREPEMDLVSPLDRRRAEQAKAALDAALAALPAGRRAVPEPGCIAKGRFVLLRQNEAGGHFSIAEIQVVSGGENVALRPEAKATGSANLYQAHTTPDKVRDGVAALTIPAGSDTEDLTGAFVANPGPDNWVQLDLGRSLPIQSIKVLGRRDAYAGQSGNYTVYVGENDLHGLDADALERADGLWTAERGPVAAKADSTFTLAPRADGAPAMLDHSAAGSLRAAAAAPKPRPVMVSKASAPRTVRLLPRGNWMDDSGPVMEPQVPAFMGSFAKMGVAGRPTRLDFARWLTTPAAQGGCGELTARVWVNRLWYLFFGQGLCPSVDDLGGQGEPCTHIELLDRLTLAYTQGGWDNRAFIRLLVTSRAYRMASEAPEAVLAKDPRNLLFARQGRWRLPAEAVRDNALAASGLLVDEIGGPTSRPYQPAHYYQHLQFPDRDYKADKDAKQWKRGVYMHWQRMFLHPALKAFDAPNREDSCPRRSVTNTPLAALVALNDPSFVEAARALASLALKAGGDDAARCDFMLRRAVGRQPAAVETAILTRALADARRHFAGREGDARKLVATGQAPVDPALDPVEWAATTQVARVVLNLHETLTRN